MTMVYFSFSASGIKTYNFKAFYLSTKTADHVKLAIYRIITLAPNLLGIK